MTEPDRFSVSGGQIAVRDVGVRSPHVPAWVVPAMSVALLGVLPAVLTVRLFGEHGFGWDFRAFYDGARTYLHGRSPYPRDSLAALADKQEFVYPAPTALLFMPLALLPYTAAVVVWTAVSLAALPVALRLLGVRDWRCCGALLLTLPAEHSLRLGTLGPVLLLLLALLWRYRDRVYVAAALAAAVALSKVFLAPMLVWLAVTRRVRAATLAGVAVAVACFLAWLPIGEATIFAYPALLHTLAAYEQTFSYSLTSLLVGLGLASTAATALAWTAGAALLVLAYRSRSDDQRAFASTLVACFVLSPIVWGHYYVLLAAPLALRRPTLGPAWILAIWITSDTLSLRHAPLFVALALGVLAVQAGLLDRRTELGRLLPGRTGFALVLAAVAAVQLAALASAAPGYTRTAALVPVTGSEPASGAGSVRVDPRFHLLCWRIWTQGLPSSPLTLAIESVTPSRQPAAFRAGLSRPEAGGCAPVDEAERRVLRRLIAMTVRYRVVVSVRGRPVLAGILSAS